MKTGAEMIAIERQRQIEEGYTSDIDDSHSEGILSLAAICYANTRSPSFVKRYWPWGKKYWKPKDKLSNLVRAGALIAAEIDRLQRIEFVVETR